MDCGLPGSSVHGIFQARVLEWGAIAFSENTQDNYTKKDLNDSDKHKGVITHLEPNILECELKWVLGSITMNKASKGWNSNWAISNPERWCCEVLPSICQQNWKTQQWPQDLKRSVFIPISKKGNAKEYSNYHTIVLISHASKVQFKILQARLQQYVNCELPDVQAGFRKGRRTRDQIANIRWIIQKQESSSETSTSVLLITPKPLTL